MALPPGTGSIARVSGQQKIRLIVSVLLLVALLLLSGVVWSYRTIPLRDTSATRFDTILVLGTPSLPDGSPSLEQRARVLEGVREYRAGVAPHIIMTGGAAHNRFVEAHTMVELAAEQGVPRRDLIEEGQAQNTLQNIFYSAILMQQHGWKSTEVVSSPSHLPRAALILQHYPLAWRMHAAPWPREFSKAHILMAYWAEATYTSKLRWIGFRRTRYLPR